MRAPTTSTVRNLRRLLLLAASLGVGAVLWFVLGESEAVVAAESAGHGVLARVNGVAITEAEVRAAAAAELRQLETRRQEVLDGYLDAKVRALLIETAARRRGVSPKQFIAAEVEARLAGIPQERVEAFYESRKDVLGQPLENVEKQIREILARQDLVAQLAASGDVEIVDGARERLRTSS